MNASGEPITKCPVCRYDLTGLPRNYTCPECGFEYDEHMRVWILKNPAFVSSYIPAISFWCFMAVLFVLKFLPGDLPARLVRVSNVFLDALILYLLFLTFLTLRSYAFVLVSPRALIYRLAIGPVRSVRWSELIYVDLDPEPRILVRGKPRRLFLPINFLRRTRREQLLTAIRKEWTNTTMTACET